MNLRQRLVGRLSDEQLGQLVASFDIVGDIAILDIPEPLRAKAKVIARAVMEQHRNVHVVLSKGSQRKGSLRRRQLVPIIGRRYTTVHIESGYRLKVNVHDVYFSPRESTERQRIASLVAPGERVLVMFAGVGPYAICIAKRNPSAMVVAAEKNKPGYRLMVYNIELNKLNDRVTPVHADLSRMVVQWKGSFDRIIMPLPLHAHKFLSLAAMYAKPHGTIHLYSTGLSTDPFSDIMKKVNECEDGVKLRVKDKRVVLPYAPRVDKVCLELEVIK